LSRLGDGQGTVSFEDTYGTPVDDASDVPEDAIVFAGILIDAVQQN